MALLCSLAGRGEGQVENQSPFPATTFSVTRRVSELPRSFLVMQSANCAAECVQRSPHRVSTKKRFSDSAAQDLMSCLLGQGKLIRFEQVHRTLRESQAPMQPVLEQLHPPSVSPMSSLKERRVQLSSPSASAAFCSCAELELLANLVNLPLCQLITLIGLSACSKNVLLATPMMYPPEMIPLVDMPNLHLTNQ